MTHFIRFPSEAAGLSALKTANLLDNEGSPIYASHCHSLDVIGRMIFDGIEVPGWHCNYIGKLPQEWEQYIVKPTSPKVIFAGVDP